MGHYLVIRLAMITKEASSLCTAEGLIRRQNVPPQVDFVWTTTGIQAAIKSRFPAWGPRLHSAAGAGTRPAQSHGLGCQSSSRWRGRGRGPCPETPGDSIPDRSHRGLKAAGSDQFKPPVQVVAHARVPFQHAAAGQPGYPMLLHRPGESHSGYKSKLSLGLDSSPQSWRWGWVATLRFC